VLITDDEQHMRSLMLTAMKSVGLEIVGEAKSGQEAVDMFKEHQPDLLLLDINMPVKNGLEALQEIMTAFPDAFVIMFTMVSEMETVERCIDLGARNYILKDAPITEIKQTILETWRNSESQGGEIK